MYYNLYKLSTIQDLQNIISIFFKYCENDEKIINYSSSINNNIKIFDNLKNIIAKIENSIFSDIQESKDINNINIIKYTNLKNVFSFSHYLNNHNNTFYCLLEILNTFFCDNLFNNVIEIDYNNSDKKSNLEDCFNYFYDKSLVNYDNLNSVFQNKDDLFNLNNFITLSNNNRNLYDLSIINVNKIFFNDINYDLNEILLLYVILSLNVVKTNGNSILSLDLNKITKNVYLEILFFLSCIFKSITLCKPKCSILDERKIYIICKEKNNFAKEELINISIPVFQNIIEKPKNKYTYSFLKFDIPLFYKNKLNETLINFERYEIEIFDHMCNLLLSSNIGEKIENQNSKQKLRLNNWLQDNSKDLNFEYFCKIRPEENSDETFRE